MGKFQVHRSDGNASELYDYLRSHGASVEMIGRPLDALVGYQGVTAVVEVKMPKGKLRPGQVDFLTAWRGLAVVLRSEADCDDLLREMRVIAAKSMTSAIRPWEWDARAPGTRG